MGNFTEQISYKDREFEVSIQWSICKGDYLTPDMGETDITEVIETMEDGSEVDVTRQLDGDILGTLEEMACEKYFN